jgi:signal transduction histidine kinase
MAVRRKRRSGKRRSAIPGLRARLSEAEETLKAIRTGLVDAVVVSGPGGERALVIEGATHPYHVLLNAMGDGAALLDPDGTILFGNRRLGEIAGASLEGLRVSRFQQLVIPAERSRFETFLREGAGLSGAQEFAMVDGGGVATPVWIALSAVPVGAGPAPAGPDAPNGVAVLMAIITDLTDRKQAEATRLRLLERLISAEDDERRRVARELHDETGQSLTALLVGLRAIEDQAVATDVRSAAQRLRRVAAQTVDEVGRLARGLHPSILDDLGLAAAARRHVSDFTKAFGVAVDLRVDGTVSPRLPPLVQTTLYRILQETLTNVARHARAEVVVVELKYQGTVLELVVRDDGVGFDVAAALDQASGLGLHGMQERVALLGGAVGIESTPGTGTVVRARIPAPPARQPRSRPQRERPRPR